MMGPRKLPQIYGRLPETAVPVYLGRNGREELFHTAGDVSQVLHGLLFIELEVQTMPDVVGIPSGDAMNESDPGRLVRIAEIQAQGVEEVVEEQGQLTRGHPGFLVCSGLG